MTNLAAGIHSDIVSLGQNPEMADMANPRGDIWGELFYLTLVDPNGYRWMQAIGTDKVLAQKALEALDNSVTLRNEDPRTKEKAPTFAKWLELAGIPLDFRPAPPVYGSEAYEAEGQGEVDAMREREDDRVPF